MHLTAEQENQLYLFIKQYLMTLYQKDYYLVLTRSEADYDSHVGERAIVFRFAHYLQIHLNEDPFFRDYNLDCEYNRNLMDPKRLGLLGDAATVPDVILHRRGDNDNNLMVIEFKGYWNCHQEKDRLKIKGFTSEDDVFKFNVGYTVLIGRTIEEIVIEKYTKGIFVQQNKGL